MSWFSTEGASPHTTLWSKTVYIRNLAAIPFRRTDSESEAALFNKADTILTKNGFRKQELRSDSSAELMSLEEKQLIGHSFTCADRMHALYLNEPCSLSISLGDKDFLVIRSVLGGLAVEESRKIASEAEEVLDRSFDFAYSEKFGYLSPDISECGSGCRFSAALFLPALTKSGEIPMIAESCRKSGVLLSPMFAKDGSFDLYKLSYKPSYRASEIRESEFFNEILKRITEYEERRVRIIYSDERKLIADSSWRAFGLLSFARRLSEDELLSSHSAIRLAIMLCDGIPPIGIPILNRLLSHCLNASVAATTDGIASSDDLDFARCEILRTILSESNTQ